MIDREYIKAENKAHENLVKKVTHHKELIKTSKLYA